MRGSATGIPSIISWLERVESWKRTKLESCSARSRICSCSRLVYKPSEFSWTCGQYTLPHTLVIWVMGNQTLGRSSCLCFFIALRLKACGQECSTEGTYACSKSFCETCPEWHVVMPLMQTCLLASCLHTPGQNLGYRLKQETESTKCRR